MMTTMAMAIMIPMVMLVVTGMAVGAVMRSNCV
jgi:hypothetical protein